jgi:hypothetical protein
MPLVHFNRAEQKFTVRGIAHEPFEPEAHRTGCVPKLCETRSAQRLQAHPNTTPVMMANVTESDGR